MSVQPFRRILAPLAVLALMGALQLAAAIGIAPPPSQLLAAIIQQIQTAAPGVVAIISFIENIAGITTYFPGSIAILVAMSATAGSPIHAVRVFVAIVIGAGLAHILDFMIGRWTAGTSLRREVSRLDIWGGVATYWHPQLAAIFSVQKALQDCRMAHSHVYYLPRGCRGTYSAVVSCTQSAGSRCPCRLRKIIRTLLCCVARLRNIQGSERLTPAETAQTKISSSDGAS